jgi:aryl-alcohol dehydrogenase-like predicted oxidoreductase
MEDSLRELQVDHVDAYYMMGENNPGFVRSDEMYEAFLAAKQAGKVRFFGVSTHENAQNVLEAAAETGRFALAQLAITPAGWYDWNSRNILPGTPSMKELQPVLAKARDAGIGLIGMKAGRYLAGRRWLGRGNDHAYDHIYDTRFLGAPLSSFQRSYAYVLEHGLDAVNADMQTYTHLAENFVAAATSREYFA